MWAHQSYLGTERNASVILIWFQPCQCYCHLRYPGEYFRSEPLSAQVSGEDHCWRTGRLQSRKEHHRADLQPTNPLLETSPAPGRPLPCLHRLQEGLQQVWHAAMWATMKTYNNSTNPICVIKHLYDKATSAVLFNNSIGDWFQTTTGIKEVCPFSPTLFNLFLERIMTDALEDHEGTVSIGGRTITNFRFADGIDGLVREEENWQN